jgi:hypothetical protein
MSHKRIVDYAISTVDRPVNYIYDLIPRVKGERRVKLFVGSNNDSYLERYRHSFSIRIEKPDNNEWSRFKEASVFHRATWNYWRSMTKWPDDPQRRGLVILEDDVQPAEEWQEHLTRIISDIENKFKQRYILALYTARTYSDIDNIGYARYPIHEIGGTQGFYYPEAVRRECAAFLKLYGVEWNEAPYDMLLADFCSRHGYPVFVTIPALIQHVGKVGTGLSTYHFAPTFKLSAKANQN